MTAVEGDDRVAGLRASLLQVAVGEPSGEEPNPAALVLLGAAMSALRASAATAPLIPFVRPLGLVHHQRVARPALRIQHQ